LQRASPHGRNVILQRVREGFVAEASLQATRYHCDAIAAEPSTIWSFPRAQVLKALRDTPELTLWWAARLAEQLRFARLRIERLSLKGASDRILHAIETEGSGGRFALASTRREWAAELGLTPEALYRSLAQLQRKGVVQIHGSELWLVAESSAVS
jgi:CRP-like cAMP-binding protein